MGTNEPSPALSEALELWQQGQTVEAEQRIRRSAQEAAAEFGNDSKQAAHALFEMASVLWAVGQQPQAADAMRQAARVHLPHDEEATQDRLTYLMNLGDMLKHLGEIAEAEEVLREGVAARAQFYGQTHSGYAFGLEPLAEVRLAAGDHQEAFQLVDETVKIFWNDGHPRVATALALRAEILKTAGAKQHAFEGLGKVSDEVLENIVSATLQRADAERADACLAVWRDLYEMIADRFGEVHSLSLQLLVATANLCREIGDHDTRLEYMRRVAKVCDALSDPEQALEALLGVALAQGDAGVGEQAVQTYQEALRRAGSMGPAVRSKVQRNFGLLMAELERPQDAEELLRQAAADAAQSGDQEVLGRAQVALGIFLQHNQRFDQAAPVLRAGVELLGPGHPDSVCGRTHLHALETGSSCGCDDEGKAFAEAFQRFVLERLPPGLVDRLDVSLENGELKLEVQLGREPSDQEMETLNMTIQHAQHEFRRGLGAE